MKSLNIGFKRPLRVYQPTLKSAAYSSANLRVKISKPAPLAVKNHVAGLGPLYLFKVPLGQHPSNIYGNKA